MFSRFRKHHEPVGRRATYDVPDERDPRRRSHRPKDAASAAYERERSGAWRSSAPGQSGDKRGSGRPVWRTRFPRSSGRRRVDVSRRSIRFAWPERDLITRSSHRVLIAAFHLAAPARCGAFADEAPCLDTGATVEAGIVRIDVIVES
jgi:hypothetical protein